MERLRFKAYEDMKALAKQWNIDLESDRLYKRYSDLVDQAEEQEQCANLFKYMVNRGFTVIRDKIYEMIAVEINEEMISEENY